MSNCVLAQFKSQEIQFQTIGVKKGLSYPKVNCVLQDRAGFLWFGTRDGLDCYNGYSFRSYRLNDYAAGKPAESISIQSLFEDKSGYLWIGTLHFGLFRFDRRTGAFKQFRHQSSDPATIGSDYVYAIHQDPKGRLWIGTSAGLCLYEPVRQSFINYAAQFRMDPQAGRLLADQSIAALLTDRTGTLWLGTLGGGLGALNPETGAFRVYQQLNDSARTTLHDVYALHEDSHGNLWLGTRGQGLVKLDPERAHWSVYVHEAANAGSLSSNYVLSVREDDLGVIWLATKGGGLCRFDSKKERFSTFQRNINQANSLAHNDLNDLFLDRSGLMWIATDGGGVCSFSTRYYQVFNSVVSDEKSNFYGETVTALLEDRRKQLWIGTRKQGLYTFDRKSEKFRAFRRDSLSPRSLRNDAITALCEDPAGNVWIGTGSNGLVRYDPASNRFTEFRHNPADPGSLSNSSIETIYLDRHHNLWIGTCAGLNRMDTQTGRFLRYQHNPNNRQSISGNAIKVMYEDRAGNLWVGQKENGLSVLDPRTATFRNYHSQPGNPKSLRNDAITSIVEAANGIMWIGTSGGGIHKFDPRTEEFTVLTQSVSRLDNAICSLQKDQHHNIWVSTSGGLSCYNWATQQFEHYTREDGLPGQEFIPGASYRSSSGELFFGGRNSFLFFQPQSLQDHPSVAPVYLTSFRLFDKPVNPGKPLWLLQELNLEHKDNFFSFEFVLLDYLEPEKNQYAYQMEGFDKTWNFIGNRHVATYTNLDPGEYTFRVKAAGKNGIWNEKGASIRLIVHPEWYQTWWFRTVAACCVIAAAFSFYRFRVRSIETQKRALAVQVAERTQDLKLEKAKLEQAYQEMQLQKDDLEKAYERINLQKEELQHKDYHLTSSINYAKRIQEAILPLDEEIRQTLRDSFILFKPRDIVSGDFYWFARQEDRLFIAVIDCTGHGVPGAFMSMIGNSLLNQIVNELNIIRPSEVLRRMHQGVRKILKQEGVEEGATDGMDIAFCVVHLGQREVEFAGANRPLWYVVDGQVHELKPTGLPVGGLLTEDEGKYSYHSIKLEEPTNFYLFTDGFADQFGGAKQKKFMIKNFKQLISEIQVYDFEWQKRVLQSTIQHWQGSLAQTDDMLVIGFRVE